MNLVVGTFLNLLNIFECLSSLAINAAKNGVNALWVTVTTKIVVLQEFLAWIKLNVWKNGGLRNVV